MSERKETPDVLGNLFGAGGEPAAPEAENRAAAVAPPSQKRSSRKPAQARPAPPAVPAPAPAAPMQWEYREVVFREFRGWRPRYVDGRERWDWKEAPVILDYLQQAGADGWELVNVGEVHNYQKTAYFKRPKPR